MLELRPCCENCQKPLPANSSDAMICSYECTFCRLCIEQTLHNVCPNCGGGFTPRPIRPQKEWVTGTSLKHHPAATRQVIKAVDPVAQSRLAELLKAIPPAER